MIDIKTELASLYWVLLICIFIVSYMAYDPMRPAICEANRFIEGVGETLLFIWIVSGSALSGLILLQKDKE